MCSAWRSPGSALCLYVTPLVRGRLYT
jgi:hypothetical protein